MRQFISALQHFEFFCIDLTTVLKFQLNANHTATYDIDLLLTVFNQSDQFCK